MCFVNPVLNFPIENLSPVAWRPDKPGRFFVRKEVTSAEICLNARTVSKSIFRIIPIDEKLWKTLPETWVTNMTFQGRNTSPLTSNKAWIFFKLLHCTLTPIGASHWCNLNPLALGNEFIISGAQQKTRKWIQLIPEKCSLAFSKYHSDIVIRPDNNGLHMQPERFCNFHNRLPAMKT